MLVAALFLAACGSETDPSSTDADTIRVAAAFGPLAEIVERVGGDRVSVIGLVPPGASPHGHELTGRQLDDLAEADLVVYLGAGFQPAVEQAVGQLGDAVARVDVLDDLELLDVTPTLSGVDGETDGEVVAGGKDPHVWLDPINMVTMSEAVEVALSELDPEGARAYSDDATAYRAELTVLDDEFESGLAECRSTVVVTSHRAFEYLARRYGLRQIPIAGVSPEDEPSARTLEAIAAEAQRESVEVVFFEEQLPADLSETLASEIGASTDVLDPIEGFTQEQIDENDSYASIMRRNLTALRSGLGCS